MTVSLQRATDALATVVTGVADDQLDAPTPCPRYTVADLLDHVAGLSLAFAGAARKDADHAPDGPMVDGSRLPVDFRAVIGQRLTALADAWDDPSAFDGMTAAGGVEMPAPIAALVALDEVIVHAWDLAAATGQEFVVDPADLATLHDFVAGWAEPGAEEGREGLFGPVVDVPVHARLVDKVIGLTGRDPHWSAG